MPPLLCVELHGPRDLLLILHSLQVRRHLLVYPVPLLTALVGGYPSVAIRDRLLELLFPAAHRFSDLLDHPDPLGARGDIAGLGDEQLERAVLEVQGVAPVTQPHHGAVDDLPLALVVGLLEGFDRIRAEVALLFEVLPLAQLHPVHARDHFARWCFKDRCPWLFLDALFLALLLTLLLAFLLLTLLRTLLVSLTGRLLGLFLQELVNLVGGTERSGELTTLRLIYYICRTCNMLEAACSKLIVTYTYNAKL